MSSRVGHTTTFVVVTQFPSGEGHSGLPQEVGHGIWSRSLLNPENIRAGDTQRDHVVQPLDEVSRGWRARGKEGPPAAPTPAWPLQSHSKLARSSEAAGWGCLPDTSEARGRARSEQCWPPSQEPALQQEGDGCFQVHACDPCSKNSSSMRCRRVPATVRYSRQLVLSRSPPLLSRQSLAAC